MSEEAKQMLRAEPIDEMQTTSHDFSPNFGPTTINSDHMRWYKMLIIGIESENEEWIQKSKEALPTFIQTIEIFEILKKNLEKIQELEKENKELYERWA